MMLKILHLLSNWKWTERAEPAADMALGQIQLGAQAVFACDKAPYDVPDAVEQRARKKGLSAVFVLTTQTADWFQKLGFEEADPSLLPEKKRLSYSLQRKSRIFLKTLAPV